MPDIRDPYHTHLILSPSELLVGNCVQTLTEGGPSSVYTKKGELNQSISASLSLINIEQYWQIIFIEYAFLNLNKTPIIYIFVLYTEL